MGGAFLEPSLIHWLPRGPRQMAVSHIQSGHSGITVVRNCEGPEISHHLQASQVNLLSFNPSWQRTPRSWGRDMEPQYWEL